MKTYEELRKELEMLNFEMEWRTKNALYLSGKEYLENARRESEIIDMMQDLHHQMAAAVYS